MDVSAESGLRFKPEDVVLFEGNLWLIKDMEVVVSLTLTELVPSQEDGSRRTQQVHGKPNSRCFAPAQMELFPT